MKKMLLAAAAALLAAACGAPMDVSSPDGRIVVTFSVEDGGLPAYRVEVGGEPFLQTSPIGLEAEGVDLADGYEVVRARRRSHAQVWHQPWGENKEVTDRHRELEVLLRNAEGVELTVTFRVFDDGLGFRCGYRTDRDSVLVTDERTEWRIASDGTSWSIPLNFDTYEMLYRRMPLSELPDADTPLTFKLSNGRYGSVHEAAIVDFPEMALRRTEGTAFRSELAPRREGGKALVPGTFRTPWRTLQVASDAVGLINSSLILNLNEPCAMEDVSWIRPMKYIGVWWGMHLGLYSWGGADHGATTEEALRYIDFAADNRIEGVLFEGWNDAWSGSDALPDFDFTAPAPDFDLDRVLSYARERGVTYILHHETGGNVPRYEAQLERDLDWAADRGIHALKTGYAGGRLRGGILHHSQYGVRHFQRVVEEAAAREIMVDAHEAVKPSGLRRTWPNFMTREAVRGMEWNGWSEGNPPSHHEILPYTRLLAGPVDYTPGVFDIGYRYMEGRPNVRTWGRPATECRVHTTLAKQIANWVVLYSPMQMACDLIDNYAGHPAFRFFRDFDADCDWSEALQGEVGEYVAVVRRAGDRYFYGATTDETGRTLTQPLTFLPKGVTYAATVYADGPDADWADNPYDYEILERTVTAADTLTVRLAPGGGQAVSFIPVAKDNV